MWAAVGSLDYSPPLRRGSRPPFEMPHAEMPPAHRPAPPCEMGQVIRSLPGLLAVALRPSLETMPGGPASKRPGRPANSTCRRSGPPRSRFDQRRGGSRGAPRVVGIEEASNLRPLRDREARPGAAPRAHFTFGPRGLSPPARSESSPEQVRRGRLKQAQLRAPLLGRGRGDLGPALPSITSHRPGASPWCTGLRPAAGTPRGDRARAHPPPRRRSADAKGRGECCIRLCHGNR